MAIRNLTVSTYVTANAAARILGRHAHSVSRIAVASGVRTTGYPGEPTRYHRDDLEALAKMEREQMQKPAPISA